VLSEIKLAPSDLDYCLENQLYFMKVLIDENIKVYNDNFLIEAVGFCFAIVFYYNTVLLLILQLTKASLIAIAFYHLSCFHHFCSVLCLRSWIRMLIFAYWFDIFLL
jgi:hypothetical protein